MLSLRETVVKPAFHAINSTIRLRHLTMRDRTLWIVTYHRVLPNDDFRAIQEEPGMVVTPETFDEHLKVFNREFDVIHLRDWLALARSGKPLPKSALAITFDDGWSDNYEFALPRLIEHRSPATLFLVSDMIGSDRPFWPNIVGHIAAQRGSEFLLNHFPLLNGASRITRPQPVPGKTCPSHHLISALKAFPDHLIHKELSVFLAEHNIPGPLSSDLLTHQQIRSMIASGYIDIGSHTRRHTRLTEGLDPVTVSDEIIGSKHILEEEFGCDVRLFCYPNGDTCALARKLVAQHYDAGLTTQRGVNWAQERIDYSMLRRFSIHEQSSNSRTKLLSLLART